MSKTQVLRYLSLTRQEPERTVNQLALLRNLLYERLGQQRSVCSRVDNDNDHDQQGLVIG